MKSIKHPASLGNIFLFLSFVLFSYSSFLLVEPSNSFLFNNAGSVLADCDTDGPYGEPCIENESYEIEKKVKIKGGDIWKDKVTDVKEDETVEFRIEVRNVGDVDVDDMKMTDLLPDEMSRIGGDGLTEKWDDFESNEEKTFIIEAKLNEEEFDTDTTFEKCVVNKAEAEQNGNDIGSDTATVCYNNAEVKELPDTGPLPIGLLGLGLAITGAALKRKRTW